MVVRGDLDLAGIQLFHRMIAAVVAELQLESFPAQRDSRKLMSEAYAKNRQATHEPLDVVHRVGTGLGIAGAVGQKYPVGLQRQDILRLSLCRNNGHLAAFAAQLAQNALLDPVIVSDYMKPLWLVLYSDDLFREMGTLAGFPNVGMVRCDHLGQVGAIHFWKGSRLRDQFLRIRFKRRYHAAHDAVVAQMPNQRACVNVAEHRDSELFEIFFGDLLRTPVGADAGKLAHD